MRLIESNLKMQKAFSDFLKSQKTILYKNSSFRRFLEAEGKFSSVFLTEQFVLQLNLKTYYGLFFLMPRIKLFVYEKLFRLSLAFAKKNKETLITMVRLDF